MHGGILILWLAHIGGESGKHMPELAYLNLLQYFVCSSSTRTLLVGLGIPIHFVLAKFKALEGIPKMLGQVAIKDAESNIPLILDMLVPVSNTRRPAFY
ncbi:uncharacterized protein BDCG_02923 [Blastomyces dermatitidis ER-3]|uniref:Uncharacterized protein n=3 Tax=Blastomyces TaxID=229219 RepID=A0A179UEH6_BLAGS|nr:uncharacterized protein BDBG_02621 [Blastomyces gilchristii SLH14081]XP_045275059.1 uncharacterized protein BDCG_02923 [Blastomyces dermatitidis ER-3]EQL32202.1 hypothetical protein BDFG_05574 [Blastomyces dermatitidis ATCC 26199]KMW66939.1 hypothetical protein BDDG_11804 [Blastomyces dermatitidis ATCC 18188]EEQ87803.1 hypothetical protein BDCG_02923 [Blastomyces dermatitidis ER-3]OAT06416.1 hypothetical protein BDBG_02621 [Blastomyces gilchristii SLH14081]